MSERTRCSDCGRIVSAGEYLTTTTVERRIVVPLLWGRQIEMQLTKDHATFCGDCLDDEW